VMCILGSICDYNSSTFSLTSSTPGVSISFYGATPSFEFQFNNSTETEGLTPFYLQMYFNGLEARNVNDTLIWGSDFSKLNFSVNCFFNNENDSEISQGTGNNSSSK